MANETNTVIPATRDMRRTPASAESAPAARRTGKSAVDLLDHEVTPEARAAAWAIRAGGAALITELEGPGADVVARVAR